MKSTIIILILISSNVYGQTLNLIPFACEGKWGFSDCLANERIIAKYDSVQLFSGCLAVVGIGSKFGLIDTVGDLVLPFKFDEVSPYNLDNKCVRARIDNKWSIYNEKGKPIRKKKFKSSTLYDCVQHGPLGGMAYIYIYSKNGKHGLISYRCNNVTIDSCKIYGELKYDDFREIGSNILALKSSNIWQLYDYSGNLVSQTEYDWIDTVEIGRRNVHYYRVNQAGKTGLIDSEGIQIIESKYDSIEEPNVNLFQSSSEWYWSKQQLFKVTLGHDSYFINEKAVEYTCKGG